MPGDARHLELSRDFDPFRLGEAINARLKPHPIAVLDCVRVPTTGMRAFRASGAPMNIASSIAARR
jgi:tRNA pseudouridine38-40 synthase